MVCYIRWRLSVYINVLFLCSEPFVVGFVQTTHTVLESIGSVSICVNLTRPLVDILDESVYVSVTDYPESSTIPQDSVLASKSSNHQTVVLVKTVYLLLFTFVCGCIYSS